MQKLRTGLMALLALIVVATGLGFAPSPLAAEANPQPTGSDANKESEWEDWLAGEGITAACYKHGDSGSNDHGKVDEKWYWGWNDPRNGKTYVELNTFNQAWFGDHWALLIVKGGSSGGPNNDGNAVYENPSANTAYFAPINSANGKHFDVSHWIVCKGEQSAQPVEVTPSVTFTAPSCEDLDGALVPSVNDDQYTSKITGPVGARVVTFTAKQGFVLTQTVFGPYDMTPKVAEDCLTDATPVDPTVNQSAACDIEGTYTISNTAGVQYLLDGEAIEAETYNGPVNGVLTAVALDGFKLTDQAWSFNLNVAAAEPCPEEIVPLNPIVVQSSACDVEGTFKILPVEGLVYLLDGANIDPGVYSGPREGTLTAEALDGYVLADEEWAFDIDVEPAKDCIEATAPVQTTGACGEPDTVKLIGATGGTWRVDGTPWNPEVPVTMQSGATLTFQFVASEGYEVIGQDTFEITSRVIEDCPTTAPPTATSGNLPKTGTSTSTQVAVALALAALGGLLLMARRRFA